MRFQLVRNWRGNTWKSAMSVWLKILSRRQLSDVKSHEFFIKIIIKFTYNKNFRTLHYYPVTKNEQAPTSSENVGSGNSPPLLAAESFS